MPPLCELSSLTFTVDNILRCSLIRFHYLLRNEMFNGSTTAAFNTIASVQGDSSFPNFVSILTQCCVCFLIRVNLHRRYKFRIENV